jgi:hypothetical protein
MNSAGILALPLAEHRPIKIRNQRYVIARLTPRIELADLELATPSRERLGRESKVDVERLLLLPLMMVGRAKLHAERLACPQSEMISEQTPL